MSQKIIGKICVTGTMVAQTPIAVGGVGGGEHVDIEIAVDGQERSYIPGSSLAGSMRAWLTANSSNAKSCDALFGWENGDQGAASRLFIDDSPMTGTPERRHGIAIRSDSGTARENFLYTRSLLPQGTTFPLNIELDLTTDSDAGQTTLLYLLLRALENGRIQFGANKSRGFGVVRLTGTRVNCYNFVDTTDDLDHWLNGQPASRSGGSEILAPCTVPASIGAAIGVEVRWSSKSDLMVKSGIDGTEADMFPLMSGVIGGGIAPVIPGTSLKGALRAQARRILLSLFDPSGSQSPVVDEDNLPPCFNIECDLFGGKGIAGRLRVGDVYCHPGKTIEEKVWIDEMTCRPEAGKAFSTLDIATRHSDHIAIDRFTGGASEGALYNTRPVRSELQWDPFRFTLDFGRPYPLGGSVKIGKTESKWQENDIPDLRAMQVALLTLLLRDLSCGLIPLGFGSNRGLGQIGFDMDRDLSWSNPMPEEQVKQAWAKFVESGGQFPRPQHNEED